MKIGGNGRVFGIKVLILLFICIFFEAVCFNLSAIATGNLQPFPIEVPENKTDSEFKMVEINSLDVKTSTLRLAFSGSPVINNVTIEIRDDAHREKYTIANTLQVLPSDKKYSEAVVRLKSNGRLHDIRIWWDNKEAELNELTADEPIAFELSVLRMSLIFILALFPLCVWEFKLWQTEWDHKNKKHAAGYALLIFISVLTAFGVNRLMTPSDPALSTSISRPVEYPFSSEPREYEELSHALMVDAFLNGSLSMRVEPDKRLFELDNPYDITQRASVEADYMYDYALYNGKYYCYFGPAPVFVFFLPYYLLNGRYIPSYFVAAFFFSVLTIAAAYLCFWEIARRYAKNVSLLIFYLTAAAAVFGSNVLMVQSCADRYYISSASMQLFFYLTVWSGFRAVNSQRNIRRGLYFVLCGIFTFLLVWSRTIGALAAAGFLAPLFIFVLIDGTRSVKDRLKDALSYLVPLGLGECTVMTYNYMRFASPFDFGQYVQLTVGDIHYNTLDFEKFFRAIWYYFFDGLQLSADFPWLRTTADFVNHTGNRFYAEENAGAFVMAVCWGVFLLPIKDLKDKDKRERSIVYLSVLVLTVLTAFMDFCVGGVLFRYICDILAPLSLTGALLILERVGRCTEKEAGLAYKAVMVVCLLTFLAAFTFIFSNERNSIKMFAPDRYLYFVRKL
ncbi:MAG: hypothetical protein J6O71_05555 [Lachnospiraceae bacterium]|nr:hypothetical protein [Lachnospiraceae bacterium]